MSILKADANSWMRPKEPFSYAYVLMKVPIGQSRTSSSKIAVTPSSTTADMGASNMPFSESLSPIIKTQGVCGGDARIAGTRIPVWILELERRLGMNENQLLKRHPSINADLLREALRYADANPIEIEQQIANNEG